MRTESLYNERLIKPAWQRVRQGEREADDGKKKEEKRVRTFYELNILTSQMRAG